MSLENLLAYKLVILVIVSGCTLGRLCIWFIEGKENRHAMWEVRLFRWLKGSQKIYYINLNGRVQSTTLSSRFYVREWTTGSIIEISRGPFRRRSAIYGPAAQNWHIVADCPVRTSNLDWVEIHDKAGLTVENTIHVISRYSSLQVMLDRIAELEKELVEARNWQFESAAALEALDMKIFKNRQRFRGPAAKEIHANIKFALKEMNGRFEQQSFYFYSWQSKFERREANILH